MISRKVIGILEDRYGTKPSDLHAAIGPCIGPESFQVGEDVAAVFKDAGFPMERVWQFMGPKGNPILYVLPGYLGAKDIEDA